MFVYNYYAFLCQVTDNVDLLSEKEKRKKEVEDKLQVLNAKKHNLVLVLKQVSYGLECKISHSVWMFCMYVFLCFANERFWLC